MKKKELNIFIVDENLMASLALEDYLIKRFGNCIRVSTFKNNESCLQEVDNNTHVVIVNHSLDQTTGLDTLKSIKEINSNAEVIMLSDKEDIALAIASYRLGAKGTVIKGTGSRKRVSIVVKRILMAPIRIIVKEVGLSERLAMFLTSFVTVGVVVLFTLFITKH